MAVDDTVCVHQAEDARLLFELQCPKRVLCAAPAKVCAFNYYMLDYFYVIQSKIII
jgi:hypothetical protein